MKLIRVDMTTQTIEERAVDEAYRGLGGRGLTSVLINTEVPAGCDPLGPENKLIFAPGTLSGTPLVNTSRLSIGAKSPLTGGIKESNVGGTVAAALGRLGIIAVIIEGQAPEADLCILQIDSDGTVVGGSLYQHILTTDSNVGVQDSDFNISLPGDQPLFVNAADYNFYPAPFSRTIDSAVDSLEDRAGFAQIKNAMGIPVSPILAPDRDAVGLVRADDPSVASPSGQGANVFKDRGGLDRARGGDRSVMR